jgi:NAD(P)-dependent dehydrogenase (short-subunit alcohol dehydrogenase family)
MMTKKPGLEGKVAFVTGAARGIGKSIAKHLCDAGMHVILSDMDKNEGEEVASQLRARGSLATFYQLDVSNSKACTEIAHRVQDEHGGVDVLVNNAGICINADCLDTTDEIWRKQVAVNLDGVFYCCRAFGQHMIAGKGGAVINLASMAGIIDVRPQRHLAYSVTKAGVAQMSRCLATEWAPHNIRVNAIAPGYVATDMPLAAGEELVEEWMKMIPIGRFIEPDEIADVVVFLASSASSSITGHVLITDGGYTAW